MESRCSSQAAPASCSASGPTTSIFCPVGFKGSAPSFFNSTIASFASFSASARCAALSSSLGSIFAYGTMSGGSNMPSFIRAVNNRMTAVSISLSFR